MFYRMIEKKRDQWYASGECTVNELVYYMERQGQLRDAQIEAIKTYLYLKIACGCQSLYRLFTQGSFNTLDLDAAELSSSTRTYLQSHPAAAALFEFAQAKSDLGEQTAPELEKAIRQNPDGIDYYDVFRRLFSNITYTDYLFSLPMGAGKTYLMAAFIYLDLYFAQNEPGNPAFAHNFMIFAPSGLKSSVVPSLRTIQRFDPSWVIPEPAATELKRTLIFEVLDEAKSGKKSNKTKNPNVQKIANHQPYSELFGLVAVTNAEKVILNYVRESNGMIALDGFDSDEARLENELRGLIGKLPRLSIFIDEVHHAATDEKKLRAVVNHWTETGNVNSVLGFSGTPYVESAVKVPVIDKLSISTQEIANIVYYYPLINGIGNFLKRPIVKIAELANSSRIIEKGVREFLDLYRDTIYPGGLTAKLGIYCGTIAKLEEVVYPIVANVAAEYGLPASCILKFYRESSAKQNPKKYVAPADSQLRFDTLDKPISDVRIVLLVQIGKEGWDCRSLTGIVLSQEGDCPKNMVLQTSCRCLRQIDKNATETALIYLNDSNAGKLNDELQKQQHISLKEFSQGSDAKKVTLNRYDRTAFLKLPKVDFYQLKVSYETLITEPANPETSILIATDGAEDQTGLVRTTDFSMETLSIDADTEERGTEHASYMEWLTAISKGSFGQLPISELRKHEEALRRVFASITYEKNGSRYFSSRFFVPAVNANIRKAFCDKRSFETKQELIPQEASLLNISNFTPTVTAEHPDSYYPEQSTVERIIKDDAGKLKLSKQDQQLLDMAIATGRSDIVAMLQHSTGSHPQKDRSFHYLPYHTDSGFERLFMEEVLALPEMQSLGLGLYYNGDRAMTEFKIKCYRQHGNRWDYKGMYTPDFLLIQRKNGTIHKAIIVETKGAGFEKDFAEKRQFMEEIFVQQNNARFCYERFEFLFLPDSLSAHERIEKTRRNICDFFGRV